MTLPFLGSKTFICVYFVLSRIHQSFSCQNKSISKYMGSIMSLENNVNIWKTYN